MKVYTTSISPYSHDDDFDFMWVKVVITEDNEEGPIPSCEVNIPIEKQDISISDLESLAIEKAKNFLSSAI